MNKTSEMKKMTEELFWQRVSNLWKMIHSIKDDLVYKVMWEDKLKELMKNYEFWKTRLLQSIKAQAKGRSANWTEVQYVWQVGKNGQVWEILQYSMHE